LYKLICCVAVLVLFGCQASAQNQPYTPGRGTPERQLITDALRQPVEKHLKTRVIFKIDLLKVQNGWAFLRATPQQPNGDAIDYHGTVYQTAIDAGAFDNSVVALLRKRGRKWQVVRYVIGATDVPYVDWDKKYHAPTAIFAMQ